ncbi:MAG: RNA-binding domain-containing protein [Thermoleophilia bacterium]|jgi:ATP-dependent DNA helicase RecG
MTTLRDILTAIQIGETTDWEFKSARGGFPRSFWETYSAMANSEGGVVVLGVSEKDDAVSLDGLAAEQIAAHQKTLWDGLNNRGVVSANILEVGAVETVPLKGLSLLAVRIPRASRAQRPVYLTGNPFGNTYRRHHEGDYRCDEAEVRRMFADADPDGRDQRILKGFTLDDLDAPSLAQYRHRMRAARGDHVWLALGDQDLLERLGGWRCDRQTGEEGLTLAGLLMFGKELAITDQSGVPKYWVDYREMLDPETRWSDRIYPDGTWESNLLQFYSRVWPRLAAAIPTPFRLENGMRRDETAAHVALREALVNALIHGDYFAPGGLVVEQRPHEIAIENGGTLLITLEQYQRGGVSECRNPGLQKMFLMIGGGEHAGSGADKIRSGWRSRHWRAPLLETFQQPDRVRLTMHMVSLIPDDTVRHLRERFGAEIDRLSSAEVQALATADIEGAVSNARLQQLLTDHPTDITRMLTGLCDRGLLVSDSRRRWTTYELSRRGAGPSPTGSDAARHLPKNPGQLLTDSLSLVEDSLHLLGDSPHLPGDSPHLVESSEVDELHRLAAPVASTRKAPAELVRETILHLCTHRFLTANRLGELLNRNPAGLQLRYLSPMVGEGLLVMKYPKATNRPDQAYTTAGEE